MMSQNYILGCIFHIREPLLVQNGLLVSIIIIKIHFIYIALLRKYSKSLHMVKINITNILKGHHIESQH